MTQHSASLSIESTSTDSAYLWDVQDILAERVSINTGQRELLVVWKPSWIPNRNMIRDGPVMRRFTEATKWKWVSGIGDLILPVEPGTTLGQECHTACAAAAALKAAGDRAAEQRYYKSGQTLQGVAKKAPEPCRKQTEK